MPTRLAIFTSGARISDAQKATAKATSRWRATQRETRRDSCRTVLKSIRAAVNAPQSLLSRMMFMRSPRRSFRARRRARRIRRTKMRPAPAITSNANRNKVFMGALEHVANSGATIAHLRPSPPQESDAGRTPARGTRATHGEVHPCRGLDRHNVRDRARSSRREKAMSIMACATAASSSGAAGPTASIALDILS